LLDNLAAAHGIGGRRLGRGDGDAGGQKARAREGGEKARRGPKGAVVRIG
jgi:hypothetical protein